MAENPGITNAGVAHLTGLNLCKLGLEQCSLDDDVIKTLGQIPGLEQVALDKDKISDAAWAEFAKVPQLLSLSMAKTEITDSGLSKAKIRGSCFSSWAATKASP